VVASSGSDTGADTPVPFPSEPREWSQEAVRALADPVYRAAVVDLLGAVAYGEISAFERMADDAGMAPDLQDKVALQAMACAQFQKVAPVMARLAELGADPYAAMQPFREAIDAFHRHTAPADWWESLVKAYVGDALANDFYREIAGFLDEDTRDLVLTTLDDSAHGDFVAERVDQGTAADPRLSGRLALWGRRLMGEALTQTQHVAAEREALSDLLAGGHVEGLDLTSVAEMFGRLTHRHIQRMARLGLQH